MRGPPDPETRSPAAANGRANRDELNKPEKSTETTAEFKRDPCAEISRSDIVRLHRLRS
jgi:hypothetical protein